jgi:hypothetical protein
MWVKLLAYITLFYFFLRVLEGSMFVLDPFYYLILKIKVILLQTHNMPKWNSAYSAMRNCGPKHNQHLTSQHFIYFGFWSCVNAKYFVGAEIH